MSEIIPAPIRRELLARGIGDDAFGKLKTSFSLVRRERTWKSKYRHKSKFSHTKVLPHWPLYGKILLLVAIVIGVLFIAGLMFHAKREHNRSKRTGRSIRLAKVLLGAVKIALFLWIPIGAYRLIQGRRGKGKYADITKESENMHATGGNSSAQPATRPWSMSEAPASHDSKYEPMGYKTAVYDPYSAYAGVGVEQPAAAGRVTVTGPWGRSVSPAPAHESGDLGTRTPSPQRGSLPPSPQPPQYHQ